MKSTLFQFKKFSPITWGLFFGYALLVGYFNFIDPYHHDFFATGFSIILYNLVRVFFVICLIWLFYAVGNFFLTHCGSKTYSSESLTISSTSLAFFSGVGISHVILLLIGFAGFYHRSTMAILTLSIFALSLPKLNQWICFARASKIYWLGCLLLVIPICLFFLTKGLYPAGGHDYYNHYFQFYRSVTEAGSIQPNEVWYHFYYSKGAALFFLSMLLTDPLGPQLGSTAMIVAGALVVFSVLKNRAAWPLLPWLGAALYFAFLIYTPGPMENLRQGGWGDLEKSHEPAAVLILAILWITIGLFKTQSFRTWGLGLISTTCAVVLVSPAMSVFAMIYLALATVFFFILKNKTAAKWTFLGAFSGGLLFGLVLLINYFLTGVPDDQSLFLYWPIINFSKVNQWGVLFELLLIHWAKTGLVANQVPFSIHLIFNALTYLRLDVWGPLLLFSGFLFGMNFFFKSKRQHTIQALDKTALFVMGGFLFLIFSLSLLVGRDQPISFYRFTTFTYGPMLCFCLLILSSTLRSKIVGTILGSIGLFFIWVVMTNFLNFDKNNMHHIIKNGLYFASGKFSIEQAYQNQQGWPGRMPWGGIYPPAEIVWSKLPPRTRIWSMHIHSYCMLPDCHFETYMSNRLSPHIQSVYFGNPKEAKLYLQKENLNYFFFSNALQLTDPLPHSPLFSPEHIATYLGIAWTDGENTLLTWKENALFPLDSTWVNKYKQSINASPQVSSFAFDAMRSVLAIAATKTKLENSDIPWYRAGWK